MAQKKKKKKPVPKKQPKFKKQEIITIDSSDSSSEEDDESDKKQAWVDKTPKDMNSYDDNRSALFGDSESEDEERIQKQGKRPNRLSRGIDPPKDIKNKQRAAHDDERSSSSGNISLGTQEDVLKHSEAASSTLLEPRPKARQGKNTSEGSQSSQAQSSESSQEESGSRKQRTITPKKLQLYTKRNEVLLHGFVRSIKEKEPHEAIRLVQKVLGNATTCKKGSSEMQESLIDANMMLQESLYNINDRTHFVKAPPQSNIDTSGSQEDDKNKGHIIRLAKKFGLSPPQIGNVLDHAAPKESDGDGGGYFSIDKAIEKIMELKDSGNSDYSESDPKEDNVAATMPPPPDGATVLGSRIKTVFEDGKEYEGTITDVHYRVAYDDGDIETMNPAEVFEKLACNGSVLDTGNDFKCKALELFSGCSLLSTLCRRKGMDTISVDNDINSNASVKADFTSSYVQSLIGSQTFDFIHASPVCRTYSRLAGGVHRTKDNYNKSSDSHSADAMLLQLYFFIVEALKKSSDTTVTIENPSDIFYCQFGRAEQKPTSIWTNDDTLGHVLIKIGGKCKCIGKHEEGVKVNNDKNFSALPIKLCQIISDFVQSKHQSLKFKRFASKCNEEDTV